MQNGKTKCKNLRNNIKNVINEMLKKSHASNFINVFDLPKRNDISF